MYYAKSMHIISVTEIHTLFLQENSEMLIFKGFMQLKVESFQNMVSPQYLRAELEELTEEDTNQTFIEKFSDNFYMVFQFSFNEL